MPGYDAEFLALKTAKSWGLTPRQWREQPEDDRAMMLAFELFEGTREAYREQYREDWHKKNPKSEDREGDREFRAACRQRALEKRGLA